jgi:hypothetical protein
MASEVSKARMGIGFPKSGKTRIQMRTEKSQRFLEHRRPMFEGDPDAQDEDHISISQARAPDPRTALEAHRSVENEGTTKK